MKRLLPCTLMKTDWEGPLDAAVPPVCVDALAALPPPMRVGVSEIAVAVPGSSLTCRRRSTPEQWDDLVPSPDEFAFRICAPGSHFLGKRVEFRSLQLCRGN